MAIKAHGHVNRFRELRIFINWLMWENTQKRFMIKCKESIKNFMDRQSELSVVDIKKNIGRFCRGYKINEDMLNDADLFMKDDNKTADQDKPRPYFVGKREILSRGKSN
jgi:hypothetical protein